MKDQKGFTLLELLIVVSILGILAAISIPAYQSYIERGERATFVSYGRSIYRSFMVYYIEYDMYPNATAAPPDPAPWEVILNKTTFAPLSLDFDVDQFTSHAINGKADAYDSPDDPIVNGEFYLWMTSKKHPTLKILISQSDEIPEEPDVWLDGVFLYENGNRLVL